VKIDPGAPIEFGLSGVTKRLEKLNSIYPIKFDNGIDFGAGKGAYSIELKSFIRNVFTFDINPDYIRILKERAKNYNGIHPFISSGIHTPVKSKYFESIFLIEVLEHIEDLPKAIEEVNRISKEKAVVYITVPNKYFILETHMVNILGMKLKGRYVPFLCCFDIVHNYIGTARRFSKKQLRNLFELYGFSLEGIDYMLPPFDNVKFARKYFVKLFEVLEKSFSRFISPTLIAVFRRN
jgi:ubiquinone/menaquinone biosynthesis C-methylase UbiE